MSRASRRKASGRPARYPSTGTGSALDGRLHLRTRRKRAVPRSRSLSTRTTILALERDFDRAAAVVVPARLALAVLQVFERDRAKLGLGERLPIFLGTRRSRLLLPAAAPREREAQARRKCQERAGPHVADGTCQTVTAGLGG